MDKEKAKGDDSRQECCNTLEARKGIIKWNPKHGEWVNKKQAVWCSNRTLTKFGHWRQNAQWGWKPEHIVVSTGSN